MELPSKVGAEVFPYVMVVTYIIVISLLITLLYICINLLNTPSTINVVLGLCGVGLIVTYVIRFIIKKVKKEIKKNEVGN